MEYRVREAAIPVTAMVALSGPLSANNGETVRRMALAGMGLTRMSEFHIRKDLARGAVVEVLADAIAGDSEDVHALFLGGDHLPRRVRAFLDFTVPRLRAFLERRRSSRQVPCPLVSAFWRDSDAARRSLNKHSTLAFRGAYDAHAAVFPKAMAIRALMPPCPKKHNIFQYQLLAEERYKPSNGRDLNSKSRRWGRNSGHATRAGHRHPLWPEPVAGDTPGKAPSRRGWTGGPTVRHCTDAPLSFARSPRRGFAQYGNGTQAGRTGPSCVLDDPSWLRKAAPKDQRGTRSKAPFPTGNCDRL